MPPQPSPRGVEPAPGLTLTYILTQKKDNAGHYSFIDPASMSVTMPGVRSEREIIIVEGMRQTLTRKANDHAITLSALARCAIAGRP